MLDTPSKTAPSHERPQARLRRDWIIVGICSVALLLVAAGVAWFDNTYFPSNGHSHGVGSTLAFGAAGDPALPSRTIEVDMAETDGGMKFVPALIQVTKGEQIRFKVINQGMLDHEFVLATLAQNLEHLEAMKRFPDMVHRDNHSVTLKPGAEGEILWRFTKAGTFDFSCLIPGHREAGMHGTVVVK